MKHRKLLPLLLALAAALSLCTPALAAWNATPATGGNVSQIIGNNNTVVFMDVPSGHWARNEIDSFSQKGIVSGYEDGSFRPDAGVTREEFCKLLVATFEQPLAMPETPSFSDVTAGRWSYPYVEVCKDFLTGYANPFGGAPAFHPTEYATREDIAVALVRMMGFRDSDANNRNYALQRFRDGGSISPNLLGYVSLACERGLVSGYEDGTFRPAKGVTRAEIVVLLNRATKQAVTNIQDELNASASILYTPDGKTATIHITAEEGASATVNGEVVKMSVTYGGESKGSYVYQFTAEGSKDFQVVVTRAGKTKTIPLTARYEVGGPALEVTECPATSDKAAVTIRGTVKDQNDAYPAVTVNGKSASTFYGGWSASLTLQEGDNPVTIVATNKLGKTTTVTKNIRFGGGAPVVEITSCPVTAESAAITVSGTVRDQNDAYPVVTVNGKDAGARYGYWSREIQLEEGVNTVTVVATNKLGKSTTVTRDVTYTAGGPSVVVTSCPVTADTASVTVSGTVKDRNDAYPTVTVNGKDAGARYGRWSREVQLQEGSNLITIVATNTLGKTTTVTRYIELTLEGPKLEITACPAASTSSVITIKGTVADPAGGEPTVTVDGRAAKVSYSTYSKRGTWSCDVALRTTGEQTITIVATGAGGKSTTVTRTVTRDYESPNLKVNPVPELTDQPTLTLAGSAYNPSDNIPLTVTINGETVDATYLSFRKTVELSQGVNTFEIVAANRYGKTASTTVQVEYVP